jgi:tRNA-binding EMAP/Myf-like protein
LRHDRTGDVQPDCDHVTVGENPRTAGHQAGTDLAVCTLDAGRIIHKRQIGFQSQSEDQLSAVSSSN